MDDPGSTVQASMFFLTPDELHKQQRPYTFKFPPYNGCPQSNMTHEKINGITVENMRGREDQFQLERNGFTILKVNTGLDFWKPLRGPVNDWPLVLCDSSLIDVRKDLAVADLLYPDLATENQVMYYRDGLKWYYLSDHEPSEIIVFKQMDSLNSACPGVPHASFWNPLASNREPPRESIEGRAMVFYD
ncbi:hypothetical protein KXX35_009247 [Aspergillus fumigatus]|nr:hypothetical protein KXX22_004437 [Aspergillus fumigatus]KAH1571801.1 hypothetical protein KXX28_006882 [Aspergillus fumigatus]KAH1668420.1 hypothetical protein KXX15_006968 [Aspergillus fumigatus]KAH1704801.1 hypothetical protein KXX23_006681 [Aspergillus fumigatus]KAH1732328.1 hypothetical protein KXX25_005935 [Aspergillus fumigatus]